MKTGQKQIEAEFVVVKGHGSILLGRGTLEALQLLRLGHIQEQHQSTYDDLRRKFHWVRDIERFQIGTAS